MNFNTPFSVASVRSWSPDSGKVDKTTYCGIVHFIYYPFETNFNKIIESRILKVHPGLSRQDTHVNMVCVLCLFVRAPTRISMF